MIRSQLQEIEYIYPHLGHSLKDLLGHIINGNVSGTFIDFKTTKTPADKKADQW